MALGLAALLPPPLPAQVEAAPPLPARVEPSPVSRRPVVRSSRVKPDAPVDLELVVLTGGDAGEPARLLLWAEPASQGGRLDLGIRLPEGLRVISGTTSESAPSDGGSRLVEVEVEVPEGGFHRIYGTARWTLPGGQVWTRAVVLDLPVGAPPAGKPELPLVALPGGGFRVELQGSAP
jgi:hypothetical protein